jgi:hypothetical protein
MSSVAGIPLKICGKGFRIGLYRRVDIAAVENGGSGDGFTGEDDFEEIKCIHCKTRVRVRVKGEDEWFGFGLG